MYSAACTCVFGGWRPGGGGHAATAVGDVGRRRESFTPGFMSASGQESGSGVRRTTCPGRGDHGVVRWGGGACRTSDVGWRPARRCSPIVATAARGTDVPVRRLRWPHRGDPAHRACGGGERRPHRRPGGRIVGHDGHVGRRPEVGRGRSVAAGECRRRSAGTDAGRATCAGPGILPPPARRGCRDGTCRVSAGLAVGGLGLGGWGRGDPASLCPVSTGRSASRLAAGESVRKGEGARRRDDEWASPVVSTGTAGGSSYRLWCGTNFLHSGAFSSPAGNRGDRGWIRIDGCDRRGVTDVEGHDPPGCESFTPVSCRTTGKESGVTARRPAARSTAEWDPRGPGPCGAGRGRRPARGWWGGGVPTADRPPK